MECGTDITIVGWAISSMGIHRIEIYCDNVFLGTAYYGITRSDVQRHYPFIANSEKSGFRFPLTNLDTGTHILAIKIIPNKGMARTIKRTIIINQHSRINNQKIVHKIEGKSALPAWLINEWKQIHTIEPQLFPEKWLVDNIPFYHVSKSLIAEHYIELCGLYGDGVSHVFLIPWLKTGGSDLETINYVQAIVNYNLGNEIVVIATENSDSPWAKRLPNKARFVNFGKLCLHLNADEQEKLLTRVLLQMSPQVVHNINSALGYRVFVKYGKALSSITNLYSSVFCADVTEEGRLAGYPFWYLPECFDYLRAAFSDNHTILDKLHEIYSFDRRKMHVHYQPIENISKKPYDARNNTQKKLFDILWAGRLDRQKRPDLLISIAEKSQDLPFKFHVYGASVLDADVYTNKLAKLTNITCYGGFDGLSSLPVEQYDFFLYTSQWDGLPNVLLEVMSRCLPVIASNVGGIAELIHHEKTGFLISPYDDCDQYVSCLKKIYNNISLIPTIVDNAYELINQRHSWEKFIETLKQSKGYVLANSK